MGASDDKWGPGVKGGVRRRCVRGVRVRERVREEVRRGESLGGEEGGGLEGGGGGRGKGGGGYTTTATVLTPPETPPTFPGPIQELKGGGVCFVFGILPIS